MHQVFTQYTNIDIIITIVINVYNTHTRCPYICSDTRLFRYIFELVIPFIDIQTATDLIAGKENILQSVIIKIANAYAATHISKFIDKGTGRIAIIHIISEMNTRFIRLTTV